MRCPDCAELRRRLDLALIDVDNAQADVVVKNRKIGQLEQELRALNEQEPESADVREVANHWKKACDHPRARVPAGGARWKKVRSRLKEKYTVEQLKRAIDACAAMPFVGPGGRSASGRKEQRFDDLELICRDEVTLERFLRLADSLGQE